MPIITFKGYHNNGNLSDEYVIEEVAAQLGDSIEPPMYSGDGDFRFITWDSYKYNCVTGDTVVYALCVPSWDYILQIAQDDKEKMLYSDSFNGGEFRKLVHDENFIDRIMDASTPYSKQDYVNVGSSYDGHSHLKSKLIPFNPERGAINDEAAANSIINVKNLEIVFKPKEFVEEKKKFVQEKVMPYLTSMIPSTTIFSYKFEGDIEDVELKSPKIVYYEADDDNLSVDERVIISGQTVELEFDSIIDDAKTYHIKIESDPTDYRVDLRLVGDSTDWISVKRDSRGDGFLVSVTKDNFSTTGDTSDRSLNIVGTLETVDDENYDGTASIAINIQCKQKGYQYNKVYETIDVSVNAVQNDDKTEYNITWNSTVEIPEDKCKVRLYSKNSDEVVIYEVIEELIGSGGTFTLESDLDNIFFEEVKNESWRIFNNVTYTEYSQEITFTNETSEGYLCIESLEFNELDFYENTNSFTINSNIPWHAVAYQVGNTDNRQEYDEIGDGTYLINQILTGLNLTNEDYRYVLEVRNDEYGICETTSFRKRYLNYPVGFICEIEPDELPYEGGIITCNVSEARSTDYTSSLDITAKCGNETEEIHISDYVWTTPFVGQLNIGENTGNSDKIWQVTFRINGSYGETVKTFTCIQRHHDYFVKLYYLNEDGEKLSQINVDSDACSVILISESDDELEYKITPNTTGASIVEGVGSIMVNIPKYKGTTMARTFIVTANIINKPQTASVLIVQRPEIS